MRRVSQETQQHLLKECNSVFLQWSGNRADFPGSMPINFSRRIMNDLQSKEYFVSEKTDGVRWEGFESLVLAGIFSRMCGVV